MYECLWQLGKILFQQDCGPHTAVFSPLLEWVWLVWPLSYGHPSIMAKLNGGHFRGRTYISYTEISQEQYTIKTSNHFRGPLLYPEHPSLRHETIVYILNRPVVNPTLSYSFFPVDLTRHHDGYSFCCIQRCIDILFWSSFQVLTRTATCTS